MSPTGLLYVLLELLVLQLLDILMRSIAWVRLHAILHNKASFGRMKRIATSKNMIVTL